eukprot:250802-Rhodomonas_salina.1
MVSALTMKLLSVSFRFPIRKRSLAASSGKLAKISTIAVHPPADPQAITRYRALLATRILRRVRVWGYGVCGTELAYGVGVCGTAIACGTGLFGTELANGTGMGGTVIAYGARVCGTVLWCA